MLNQFINVSLNPMASSGMSESGTPVVGVDGQITVTPSSSGFTELLNSETSMAGLLGELKAMLSPDDFLQLESLLAAGQSLPLPEIVAALRQFLSESGLPQLPESGLQQLIDQVIAEHSKETPITGVRRVTNMAAFQRRLKEAQQAQRQRVRDFVGVWNDVMRHEKKRLDKLFHRRWYPNPADVEGLYWVRWNFLNKPILIRSFSLHITLHFNSLVWKTLNKSSKVSRHANGFKSGQLRITF